MDPLTLIGVISGGVAILTFLYIVTPRKSDAAQVSITQEDIHDSNVVEGSSGGLSIAAD